MDTLIVSAVIGVGATFLLDLWMIARKRLFGTAPPNYGLVGRWIAYMPRGQFRHDPIARSPAVRGELAIGWVTHYLVGVAFAALLLGTCGLAWVRQPTLAPALAVGIATVLAPFLLLQPGMGAGIAAARTPRPNAARLQSLVTHAVFGVGLYVMGWVCRPFV